MDRAAFITHLRRCHLRLVPTPPARPPIRRAFDAPDTHPTVVAYRNGMAFGQHRGWMAGYRAGRPVWLAVGLSIGFSAGALAVVLLARLGIAPGL